MTETETQIRDLHQWYCERTGLKTKLCFSQRLWFDMLRSYDHNGTALRADAELIIRHLKREISRDKRNLGALKPINFLQPDNFDADLAVAKLARDTGRKPHRPANREPVTAGPIAAQIVDDAELRAKHVAGLKSLRQSLRNGHRTAGADHA
jgi:hypothetical protein